MLVQEGPGWRFCVDGERHPYSALVGGEGWATELTASEAMAFRDGCLRLAHELRLVASQLMPEESICLELESGPLWLELEGFAELVTLRMVLEPGPLGRGFEGRWTAEGTAALLAALHHCVALEAVQAGVS